MRKRPSGSALCFLSVCFLPVICLHRKGARYVCSQYAYSFMHAVFALSWFVTRIYAFGFIVIKSTLTDPYVRAEEVGGVEIRPHTTILNGLLIFLYILHIYWSYLILRIIVRALSPDGKLDDIREEEDASHEIPKVANEPKK